MKKIFQFVWKYSLPGLLKCDPKSYYVGIVGGMASLYFWQKTLKPVTLKPYSMEPLEKALMKMKAKNLVDRDFAKKFPELNRCTFCGKCECDGWQ